MKAKEVLKLLHITRQTLTKYVKRGLIKTVTKGNGRYDYDEQSVYSFLNKGVERKSVIYARVSTNGQKKALTTQIDLLKQFCFNSGIKVQGVYQDIASGIDFSKREQFFDLLDEVIDGKIQEVVISYKDRLSRVAFSFFSRFFLKYNCKITVMSEVGNPVLDKEEVFEEIISLLHCYSMKLYSKRNKDKGILEITLNE